MTPSQKHLARLGLKDPEPVEEVHHNKDISQTIPENPGKKAITGEEKECLISYPYSIFCRIKLQLNWYLQYSNRFTIPFIFQ